MASRSLKNNPAAITTAAKTAGHFPNFWGEVAVNASAAALMQFDQYLLRALLRYANALRPWFEPGRGRMHDPGTRWQTERPRRNHALLRVRIVGALDGNPRAWRFDHELRQAVVGSRANRRLRLQRLGKLRRPRPLVGRSLFRAHGVIARRQHVRPAHPARAGDLRLALPAPQLQPEDHFRRLRPV